jgi:hypothetical protein
MKQIFRCEYCDKMGVEEEIAKHELECIHNYNKRSCLTCKHKELRGMSHVICKVGQSVQKGCIIEYCNSYEWDERDNTTRNPTAANSMFGGLFGF